MEDYSTSTASSRSSAANIDRRVLTNDHVPRL
jgi:hypothetical protein